MPGIYEITPTTFNRPNDRLPEDLDGQLFQKYVGEYDGQIWFVNHNLKSTNLLVEFWKDNTPYAYWWAVDVIDYDNIQVQWNMPVHGRAVVYAVRDFVGVSMVYDQTIPSDEWIINHNFGTRDILIDVWVNGALLVPDTAEAYDLNNIRLKFSTPVDGKAVLIVIDPKVSPYLTVEWDHITGKPSKFPPESVPMGTATLAEDANALGGKQPTYYLNTEQLGKSVAPLELDIATGQYVVPIQHLPDQSKIRFRDHANMFTSTEVYIDDENSPLRMQWVAPNRRVVLSTAFLVRKLRLLDSEPNLNYPKAEIEASSEFLVRLKAGVGIIFRQLDLNTLEIANESGATKRFTLASLPDGSTWNIIDPMFATPGDYQLQLYETQLDTTVQTGFSDHVLGTPSTADVFATSGNDLMVLNGNRLEVKVEAVADHFVYNEYYMNDGFADTTAPWGATGMWSDETNGRFIVGTVTGGMYTFYSIDMSVATTAPIVAVPQADILGPVHLGGALLYMLRPDASGMMELVSTNFANLPTLMWVTETTFSTEPYPVTGAGVLRIRVTPTHLFVLNTGFNTVSGYERSTGAKIWEISPTKVLKDFDVWPDGYMSISLATESVLWVSNAPVTTTTPPVFAPSVDKLMGASAFFAFGFTGALGIMPNDKFWRADDWDTATQTIYAQGEQVLWLKGSYAWTVSNLWSVVTSMAWSGLNLTGFDDVKIAFYPGKASSMPDTLYRWIGGAFAPFPAEDFPAIGQPLSIVNSMTVLSGQELSYALYFKRGAAQWLNPSFVDQNFECQFQAASLAMIVPISGDGRPGTLQVTCAPNQVTVTNNSGSLMTGLRLLAIPMA